MTNAIIEKFPSTGFVAHTLPHKEAKLAEDAVETWRKPVEETLRKTADYLAPEEVTRLSQYIAREVLATLVDRLDEALRERDEQRKLASDATTRMRAFQEGLVPLLGHLLPRE